ncbi:NUDIX domain-containing protein [Arthrobacter sp. OAP107]|uniref:NUDIX domain-containing protein n=1 Tax=Arthrobacter sp. OAP107 TaxID=3156445 RepID=UPI00339775CC
MSTIADFTRMQAPAPSPGRKVVAVVVEWRDKIALLKRSRDLAHDRGRWHCVTGYLEPDASPEEQAFRELFEETGLATGDLLELREGPVLMLSDGSGTPWLVHTFTAVTSRRRLSLDWEHESYRWTLPGKTARFTNRVSWLDSVLEATGHLVR